MENFFAPRCPVWISIQHAEDIPGSADPGFPHKCWNSMGTRTFCSALLQQAPYILYGDSLNLGNFILKMTKFNKLNLAWPGWLHSIPWQTQNLQFATKKWNNKAIFEIRTSMGDFPYRNPLLNLPSGALLPTGEATNGVRILGTLLLRSRCSSTGRRGTPVVRVSRYFTGKVPSLEYQGQVYWSQQAIAIHYFLFPSRYLRTKVLRNRI